MAGAAATFMEIANDDILTEILLRLPDARSIIQSSLVSKRWNSLLLKGNDDYFKNRFVDFHQNSPKFSELLFNVSKPAEGDFHRLPLTPPSESEAVPFDLSFVPPLEAVPCGPGMHDRVILLANCGDLVLLSRGLDKLFVCNMLTMKCLALPEVPRLNLAFWQQPGSSGYAIASNQRSYKVVIIFLALFNTADNYFFATQIFHPETGEWRFSTFLLPLVHPPRHTFLSSRLQVVVVGGVLYWLDGIEKIYGLASVDPFGIVDGIGIKRRLIRLPERLREINVHMRGFKDKFRLGAVCGRLRMSQLTNDSSRFELLIWELNSDDSSWVLVHEAALENDAVESLFFVLAFHPSDKNVIFFVRDKEVFRYNFVKDEYERVSKFPAPNGCEFNAENVAKYLKVLTIVHPTWPSPTSVLQHHPC